MARLLRALCWLLALSTTMVASAATDDAPLPTQVWNFRDVALDDGGSVSGHFTYSFGANSVSAWSVWVTGGNTGSFPAFEYRPDNSSLGQGSGGEIGFFATDGSQRQFLFRPSTALDGDPVYVPLYLDFPASSAYESFGGDAPRRLIQSGALFTDPAPTRVRWFFQGATFGDGGVVDGYVDKLPGVGTIVKAALRVSGGNTATFPALTYTLANSTPAVLPFYDELAVNGSTRELRYAGQAPLTADGGRVALDGAFSVECFNCAPYRSFSGTLRGVTDEIAGDGFE